MTPKLGDKVTFVQPFPCTGRAVGCRTKDATGATLVMDQRLWDVEHARSRSGSPRLHSNRPGGGGDPLPVVSESKVGSLGRAIAHSGLICLFFCCCPVCLKSTSKAIPFVLDNHFLPLQILSISF